MYSELQLRGHPSMMSPQGGAPAGHDHGSMGHGNMDHGSMAAKPESQEPAVAAGEHLELNQLPQAYFGMWEALHSDNLADWQTAAELFYTVADEVRSEEHTSELQSRGHLVCRLLLEKK